MRSKPYTPLERVIAVLLTVAAVLVAGLLTRTATTVEEESRRIYVDVATGEAGRIGEHTRARIVGITVGDTLAERESLVASAGKYVVVEYELAAGPEKVPSIRTELLWGDKVYRELDSTLEPTPPGYTSTRVSLFEVPEDALGDLTFVIGRSTIIMAYEQWLRWRPELTDEQIAGSRAATVSLPRAELRVTR